MSGSTIGGVVGGVIGFWVGGPTGAQIGFMAGSYIGSSFDHVNTPGPRLGDIPLQTSQEGVARPIAFGTPPPFPGNIIQAGDPVRVIEQQDVDNGKGGPKQTTDSEHSYQTFAIRVCEGEVDLIRFWIEGKLAYSTIAGEVPADSVVASTKFRWYRGTEDQMPDPALEALPAEKGGGVGRTLAYRGTAYIVFDNFETTPWGGRIPQFSFQVSTVATIEENCTEEGLIAWYPLDDVSPGGPCREIVAGRNGIYSDTVSSGGPLGNGSTGSMVISENSDWMIVREPESGFSPVSVYAQPFTVSAWIVSNAPAPHEFANVIKAITGTGATYGVEWSLGFASPGFDHAFGGGSTVGGSSVYLTAPSAGGGMMTLTSDATASHLYLNGELVASGTPIPQGAATLIEIGEPIFPTNNGFRGAVSDLRIYNYAMTAQQVSDAYVGVSIPIWEMPDAPGVFMDAQGTIVSGCQATATFGSMYLDEVVTEIARRCDIDSSQLDLTEDETVEVRGLLIGQQMTGQAVVGTGATTYFRDYIEADVGAGRVQIVSVPRGGGIAAAITSDDLLESDEDLVNVGQGIERPRRILLSYSSPASKYATRVQMAERESINVPSTGDQSIQLPVVLTDDEAKQKAEIIQKVLNEEARGTYNFKLPFYKYAHLVPSDIITLDDVRLRITKLEVMDGEANIEAVRDRASNYVSAAIGSAAIDPSAPVSSAKGPSIGQALNLPRLTTAENKPGMYLAVTGVTDAWPGADIYALWPGSSQEVLVKSWTKRATMGVLTADITSSSEPISVNVYNGRVLSSVSTDQLAAGLNGIAITSSGVSEVAQFQTAVESDDNIFEMTDVDRGRLETDAVSHVEGDEFLLLDNALFFLPIDASYAGLEITFRFVTRGTPRENNDTITVTFDPQFTGPAPTEFYTNASGAKYTDATGAFYYRD